MADYSGLDEATLNEKVTLVDVLASCMTLYDLLIYTCGYYKV